ncbi:MULTISPECIES: hypothetical protein [Exiguobacterium]|uniref:hypothetical protein n=1 Tax=Exiguobacterium TaxID=33986 RepID=UPI001BE6F5B4|nr:MULTISPECIES: hypothetical protein [Exiguobacterium]MCT4783316.1 hypothetical protein [Exiguobacterium himgiriensis]
MDFMWLLILFGLFMLGMVIVFISSVLNAMFRQLHPLVHVVIVSLLVYLGSSLFMDQNVFWPMTLVAIISYTAPLLVIKLYNKGVRVERKRQT